MTMTYHTKQRLSAFAIVLGMVVSLACNSLSEILLPLSSKCESAIEPTQQDVDYSLAFTGDIFTSTEWERSYTVKPYRTSVTWLNNDLGGLAYLEYLIYSCGYTSAEIDGYINEKNFKEVLFQDYQNLQIVATCTDPEDNLTLYQFTGEIYETKYSISTWVKLDNSTRVLTMVLALPQTSPTPLSHYAERVFPQLSSCPE